ncbi:MAG: ATP-binding cassette domain-containing protein, partial [Prosthecobacter sp.]|nr:ATP-binding cassette domain-containing protein [Prosthecobacter sp.]
MLELISVSRVVSQGKKEALSVLDQVSFGVPPGHLMVITGAPGSGKTSLLNILAGIQLPTSGTVMFQGKDGSKRPLHPNAIGHVPASDETLNEMLTVRESLMSALLLRVAGQTKDQRVGKASHLLVGVGLETVASQRVRTLTLAQRRRLKLALALVSDPALVLCDEFTDGLDVKSERELAALLKFVAGDHPARVVIHATQTLGNLAAYDTAVILHEGRVCFHGPGRAVTHYFSIPAIEELYSRLAKRPAQRWGESWMRHRDSYYDAFKLGSVGEAAADEDDGKDSQHITLPKSEDQESKAAEPAAAVPVAALPSAGSQAKHLALRRWTTMRRNKRELLGNLVLLIAAPAVTAALVLPNMHYLQDLAQSPPGGAAPEVLWPAAYTCAMALLVQVMFVLAMGVRNGSREIASERGVFERERTGGLRTGAYLLSKLGIVIPLALIQCFTLGLFLEVTTGGLPGYTLPRLMLLGLTGVAFSTLCLGISAHSRTAERAHSQAWLLAFANVLLAGAILGFPRVLGGVLQPLV